MGIVGKKSADVWLLPIWNRARSGLETQIVPRGTFWDLMLRGEIVPRGTFLDLLDPGELFHVEHFGICLTRVDCSTWNILLLA